jgi:hypothetical protein
MESTALSVIESPKADYHSQPSVSRSKLATFAESPRLYEAMYVTKTVDPVDESDALTIGTGTHAVCLKDAIEISKIVMIPDSALTANGKRRGKAWESFVADNPSKTLMLPKQLELCRVLSSKLTELIGAFVANPRAKLEQEYHWCANGLDLRAKLDIIVPTRDGILVVDLKTAADVSEWGFWKAVRDRRLWLQDAHYTKAAESYFSEPVTFLFAAVEKTEPYRTRVYSLSSEDRARSRVRHRELCEKLAECHASGDFAEAGEGDIVELKPLGELK